MDWHQLWKILSAPDNVPIAAIAFLVPFYTWYGFWGPANLPAPILKALNDAAANIMAMTEIKSTLIAAGFQPSYKGPDEFRKFIAEDMARNRIVIERANITVE